MVSEKKCSAIYFERLKNALVYIKNDLINSNDNTYLTADPLTDMDNIIVGSNNIILRKVNAKPSGYDKMFMDLKI